MKNLLIFLSLVLLFSCAKKAEEEVQNFSKINLSMDTVVVDPGDEIINLRSGLWGSMMSEDNKFLFKWNSGDATLDKINLDELRLEKKIKFEKEGPNGVGEYVSWASLMGENAILMSALFGGGLSLFDMEGEKIRDYKIDEEFFDEGNFSQGNSFEKRSIVTSDGDFIYGFWGNFMSDEIPFIKADFREKQVKEVEFDGIEEVAEYRVALISDEMNTVIVPEKTLLKIGDKIIISSTAYSRLYVLDLQTDSMYQVNYTPTLTPNGKKGGYEEELSSVGRLREVMAEIDTEINFQAPIWDEQNRKFYRFSFETKPTDIDKGPVFISADLRPISKIYLSIFDENFNLLGETVLDQLQKVPNSAFVKDGKIWSYVNLNDELGFVRMTIEYQ